MNNHLKKLRILLVCMLWLMAGCGNTESTPPADAPVSATDAKEKVEEAMETTKDFAQDQYAEYRESIEAKIDALEEQHTALGKQAKQVGSKVNKELQHTIDAIEKSKQKLRAQLDPLKSANGKALEDLKSGVNQAVEELEESYNTALRRFSNSQ